MRRDGSPRDGVKQACWKPMPRESPAVQLSLDGSVFKG